MSLAACCRASDCVGVGVAGSGDILAIGVKLYGEAELGDEFAYLRANNVQCGNRRPRCRSRRHHNWQLRQMGPGQDRLNTRTIL